MTEKPNQPREYDAVLGGKNSLPVNAAVLGGIEGVKLRLTAADELVRVEAVRDTVKYGEAGLDVAIASLKDKSPKVRQAVLNLLEEKVSHSKVKALLGKELKLVNDGNSLHRDSGGGYSRAIAAPTNGHSGPNRPECLFYEFVVFTLLRQRLAAKLRISISPNRGRVREESRCHRQRVRRALPWGDKLLLFLRRGRLIFLLALPVRCIP